MRFPSPLAGEGNALPAQPSLHAPSHPNRPGDMLRTGAARVRPPSGQAMHEPKEIQVRQAVGAVIYSLRETAREALR